MKLAPSRAWRLSMLNQHSPGLGRGAPGREVEMCMGMSLEPTVFLGLGRMPGCPARQESRDRGVRPDFIHEVQEFPPPRIVRSLNHSRGDLQGREHRRRAVPLVAVAEAVDRLPVRPSPIALRSFRSLTASRPPIVPVPLVADRDTTPVGSWGPNRGSGADTATPSPGKC
jgi:hypothetical protein